MTMRLTFALVAIFALGLFAAGCGQNDEQAETTLTEEIEVTCSTEDGEMTCGVDCACLTDGAEGTSTCSGADGEHECEVTCERHGEEVTCTVTCEGEKKVVVNKDGETVTCEHPDGSCTCKVVKTDKTVEKTGGCPSKTAASGGCPGSETGSCPVGASNGPDAS